MTPSLERSLWISAGVLSGLLVLLVLTVYRVGGNVPALRPLGGTNRLGPAALPVDAANEWFQPAQLTRLIGQTNFPNPFYTAHFAPPPPPSTKPVELTYLGFMDSDNRPRRALVQVNNATQLLTNGSRLVADHVVKDIARRTLTLTNGASITNVLEFRIKKVIEVPAQ